MEINGSELGKRQGPKTKPNKARGTNLFMVKGIG